MSQETKAPPERLPRLRQNLVDSFNWEELRTLCFDLRVEFDDLGGEGRADKARELVAYCDRHGRIADLVAVCLQLRPQIPWDEVKTYGNVIGDGLTALRELMQRPEVQSAASAFRSVFQATCEQIGLMARYKGLHDRFQKLEDLFRILYRAQKRLQVDETTWEDIAINEPELQSRADELLDFARQTGLPAGEMLWVARLDHARQKLNTATEGRDAQPFKEAMVAIWKMLNREPSQANTRLVMAARSLHLADVCQAMTAVLDRLNRPRLDEDAQHQFDKLGRGVQDLCRLQHRLDAVLDGHDDLQMIDDHLRRIEASLDQGLDELAGGWEDLEPLTQLLCQNGEISRATVLKTKGDELFVALESGNPGKTRDVFLKYRSEASRIFSQTDADLVALCSELQRIDRPLASILDGAK